MIHTKTNYTAKALVRKAADGEIIFDTALQRGYVWDYTRKSLLIHSILVDYAVPQFYMRKAGSKYEVFDGKQRYSAIRDFMNDEYALRDVPDIMFGGENLVLNKKKFSDLPEELQDLISGYSLDFQVFDDATDEQIAEMFFRLNNGKQLKKVDLIKARSTSIEVIEELRRHKLFKQFYSNRQIQESADIEMIMRAWMILFGSTRSLLSSRIEHEITNAEISEDQVALMEEVFDYYSNVLEIISDHRNMLTISKMNRKAAIVSVIYAINYAIKNCILYETFAAWAESFFTTNQASSNEAYNRNVISGGLAKEKSIMERFNIVRESLADYCKNK